MIPKSRDEGEAKSRRYEIITKSLYFILENGDKEIVKKVTEQIMSAVQNIFAEIN